MARPLTEDRSVVASVALNIRITESEKQACEALARFYDQRDGDELRRTGITHVIRKLIRNESRQVFGTFPVPQVAAHVPSPVSPAPKPAPTPSAKTPEELRAILASAGMSPDAIERAIQVQFQPKQAKQAPEPVAPKPVEPRKPSSPKPVDAPKPAKTGHAPSNTEKAHVTDKHSIDLVARLQRCIREAYGSGSQIARELGVKQPNIPRWIERKHVPEHHREALDKALKSRGF